MPQDTQSSASDADTLGPRFFLALKAFVVHDEKVLLLRESSANPVGTNAAKYDVAGGRMEHGERFDETLLREIHEETGLTVTIGAPFYVSEWRPLVHGEPWQIVGIFFTCQANTDHVVLSRDHDHYAWINPQQYRDYPLIDNLVPVFETFVTQR